MTKEKASSGNISLVQNAARDKSGKRKGSFSQVDHSINAIAGNIGLDAYGIYHFLLSNAGGNFWYSSTTLTGVFKKDRISKNRICKAINALIAAGLLEKEKIGQDGKRPLYNYRVYEVSTKQHPATAHVTDTPKQELSENPQHLMPSPPAIDLSIPQLDMSEFSADEIEQAATSPAQKGEQYMQHILNICQNNGVFSKVAKDKVIECCRIWYSNKRKYADDNLIAKFADTFSADSTQNPETVYSQVVVSK